MIGKRTKLPAQAIKVNGTWLDQTIDGYETVSVEGRDAVSVDYKKTDNVTDGSYMTNRRHPARTIKVNYIMGCDSLEDLRTAYNELNAVLNADDLEITFADEPDVYYKAIYAGGTDGTAGLRGLSASMTFMCFDPYKYSISEKSFTASGNPATLTIENDGAVAVPIRYEMTHTCENGFIGIVGANGVMQFGAAEELDGETYEDSQTLMDQDDIVAAAVNTSDSIYALECSIESDIDINGTMQNSTMGTDTNKFLRMSTLTAASGKWEGCEKTIAIPADSAGEAGAVNSYMWFRQWFQTDTYSSQTGFQSIGLLTDDNYVIAGINLIKDNTTSNVARCDFIVNGTVKKSISFTPSKFANQGNPFRQGTGCNDLLREGANVRFHWAGTYYSFYDPDIEELEATQIQIAMGNCTNRNMETRKYLSYNGIRQFRFEKHYTGLWRNLPNRYSADDAVIIDGNSGTITVNDMPRNDDEVIGSSYFKAEPGTNTVEITTSDWIEEEQTFTAYIREAWL